MKTYYSVTLCIALVVEAVLTAVLPPNSTSTNIVSLRTGCTGRDTQ